jgi:hypothetical protein
MEAFYHERLGFWNSDEIQLGGVGSRCSRPACAPTAARDSGRTVE